MGLYDGPIGVQADRIAAHHSLKERLFEEANGGRGGVNAELAEPAAALSEVGAAPISPEVVAKVDGEKSSVRRGFRALFTLGRR